MMRKKITKLLTLVLSAVMISSFTVPVMASTTDVKDALIVDKNGSDGDNTIPSKDKLNKVESRTGSIEITLSEGKTGTSKQDVEFALTRVADIVKGEYVLTEDYKSAGVDLNNIKNASDLEAAATKLVDVVSKGVVQKTDMNGKIKYSDVKVGVYLLQATKDDKYDEVTPLLVSIPTWSEEEGNMMYDISVLPKHTPRPEPEKPQTPGRGCPQTDLNSPILWYFGGAASLLVVLIVVNVIWKKKRA